jgi:hypothetical protein
MITRAGIGHQDVEEKRRRKRKLDRARKQRKRAKLKEAKVKQVECCLDPSTISRLRHFAVIYEASSQIGLLHQGGLEAEGSDIGVGGFLGLLIEDILDGPEKSPVIFRASKVYGRGRAMAEQNHEFTVEQLGRVRRALQSHLWRTQLGRLGRGPRVSLRGVQPGKQWGG